MITTEQRSPYTGRDRDRNGLWQQHRQEVNTVGPFPLSPAVPVAFAEQVLALIVSSVDCVHKESSGRWSLCNLTLRGWFQTSLELSAGKKDGLKQ